MKIKNKATGMIYNVPERRAKSLLRLKKEYVIFEEVEVVEDVKPKRGRKKKT